MQKNRTPAPPLPLLHVWINMYKNKVIARLHSEYIIYVKFSIKIKTILILYIKLMETFSKT